MTTSAAAGRPAAVADRFDPAHYAAAHVPSAVRAGDATPPGHLPVGSPGKVGLLELDFRREGARSVLAHRFQKSPLQVMRPLYCDPALPGVPLAYVMSTGGGIVGGDRLRTEVRVGPDAHVVVTTQASTKIHRTDSGHATQVVRFDVDAGAVCEWIPDPAIPFAGSRLHQHLHATVAEGATLALADVVAGGRLGRGECWELGAYTSTVEIARPDGRLLTVDTTRLVGAEDGGGPAAVGGHRVVGALFVVTDAVPARELADLLHEAALAGAGAVSGAGAVGAGASTLPDDAGAWLRVLGHETEDVVAAVTAAWSAARLRYAGVPAPDLRKA